MYIANIAFSFDWFLTIPGILISGGVLLLIIALIMMIVTSSQNKKETKVEVVQNTEAVANDAEVNSVVDAQTQSVASPAMDFPVATEAPLGPIETPINVNSVIPEVEPVIPVVDPIVTAAPVVPIEPVAVIEPSAPVMPVAPVMEVGESVIPEITPAVNTMVEPVTPIEVLPEAIPIPVVESVIPTETIVEEVPLETPDATNLEKTSVNIYGGNPIPPIPQVVDAPRPIYGGADPLEATQKLPKVEVHHEPYSTRIESIPVEIPAMEPVAPVAPIPVQPIPEMPLPLEVDTPVIEPATSVAPIVIPDMPTKSEVVRIPDIEEL